VQGVADLVVLLPEEIWARGFKTDEVRPAELPEKTRLYAPQLKLTRRHWRKLCAPRHRVLDAFPAGPEDSGYGV